LINEYSLILIAEHFLYLPIIGVLLILISIIDEICERAVKDRGKILMQVLSVIVSVVCVLITIKQNTYWRGEVPLFERTIQFQKDFGRARILLAKAYYREGRYKDAVIQGSRAIEIMQGYIDKIKNVSVKKIYEGFQIEAYFDMAHSYEAMNLIDDAINAYRELLNIDGEYSTAHNNLGVMYARRGDIKNAIKHFKEAVRISGGDISYLNNLNAAINAGKDLER
jgi:tetratricopeptide (TPR) repeat protein